MSRNKKILILISALLLLLAIGVGIYFGLQQLSQKAGNQTGGVFPTSPSSSTVGGGEGAVSSAIPIEEEPTYVDPNLVRLTQLTKGPVVDYFVVNPAVLGESVASSSLPQSAVFYLKESGDVIRIHGAGNEDLYFSFGLTPLRVIQSPNGSFVIIRLLSGRFALLDVAKRAFELLPEETVSATFSPDGKKLAYLAGDSSGRENLFTRNLLSTKRETTKLFSLFIEDVSLMWPAGSRIYLVPPESFHAFQTIWYFDMDSKTMGSFVGGSGVGVIFSSVTSSAMVFQNANNITINARIVNTKTGAELPLSISTLRSKCSFAFDSADIVCAAPQTISKTNGITLPDDYNAFAVFTNDYLYQLSASQGYIPQALLSSTQVPFDATRVRAMNNELFFVNRLDDSLYEFKY